MRGFDRGMVLDLPLPSMMALYEMASVMHYSEKRDDFYAYLVSNHGTKDHIETFVDGVYTNRTKTAAERKSEKDSKIAEGIRGVMREFGAA